MPTPNRMNTNTEDCECDWAVVLVTKDSPACAA